LTGRLGPSRVQAAVVAFSVALSMTSPCSALDTEATLVLGWAELDAKAAGPEYRDAASLVPRQLMAALSFARERYLSSEELEAASREKGESGVAAARTAVAEARKKRDIAALSVRDPAKRAADVASEEAALATAEAALAAAIASKEKSGEAPPPPTADSVMAVRSWAEHEQGALVPASGGLAKICAEKNIDLLVHGVIRPKGDYIAVDLALYVAALGRDVWSGTEYAFADGLGELIAAFTRPAAEAVMGRAYARVAFRVSPPVADLYLDGAAFADDGALYFEAGSHVAEARAIGYDKAAAVFDVTPGSDAFVDLSLSERDSTGFSLASDPPGAAVHIDGHLEGYAPVELPGAAYSRVVRISMPGFDDVQVVVRPESQQEDRLVALETADGSSFDERFDEKKTAFYHSLGWFIVSLPVTVISGGLFQTYYQSSQAYAASGGTDADVIDKLNKRFYSSQAVFWASASVSTGLATLAVVKLVSYIKAAR